MSDSKSVLFVVTSHNKLGDTDNKTGFWWEELATPYRALKEAGHVVAFASPKGGRPPHDPSSLEELDETPADVEWFMMNDEAMDKLERTQLLSSVELTAFDAVFFPGGHGPMWDLASNDSLGKKLRKANDEGVLIAAVCHGPAALLSANTPDGNPVLDNREVTGFSNEEEQGVGLEEVVPFLLESKLRKQAKSYDKAPSGKQFVIRDGNLITGQNPGSSAAVANELLEALS
jgi:putative intracellular protease/amidase